MSRGSRIVAIDTESQPEPGETAAHEPVAAAEAPDWDADDEPAQRRSFAWMVPALAIAIVLAWSGFYAWTQRGLNPLAIAPDQAVSLLVNWCQPVLLICVIWLLVTRNSTREAARFSQVARLLSTESANLETRLRSVNSELSLAREFITAQGRDLEALGRIAADRLAHNANELQGLIRDNGTQVDAIGSVSAAALANMEALRGHLPVIASSAKDLTNNIATAGRAANSQVQEMIQAFKRVNEFGQASERQVIALRAKVDEALELFTARSEDFDQAAAQRFAALRESSDTFRTELDRHEIDALAAIRSRASALAGELADARAQLEATSDEGVAALHTRLAVVRDESGALTTSLRDAEQATLATWQAQIARMHADMTDMLGTLEETDGTVMKAARQRMLALTQEAARLDENMAKRNALFDERMAARRAEADSQEAAAMIKLSGNLESLDAELAERTQRQTALAETLATQAEQVAAQVSQLESRITEVAEMGGTTGTRLADTIGALFDRLGTSQQALAETDAALTTLTDSSVRLLEIIQAGVQHSRNDLPAAISSGAGRLTEMESRIITLCETAKVANSHGESLSAYVLASAEELAKTSGALESLHASLADQTASQEQALGRIQHKLSTLADESRALAAHSQGELAAAITSLSTSAQEAVAGIESLSAASIGAIAARLGDESGTAIEAAMRTRTAELAGQMEQAVAHAAGVGREATIQLRDQLSKVNELTGNLERRVAHARERAEDQVDNDFARRVALITDSLNSNAIDISKAMAADVSDTAWAAYLRGDRGVFTRRAVSLIDGGEARSIMQVYENDADFREHVSRYIHDFEAMLRQLLSTRDGHAMSVTLLSSDMGKLYVSLAQSIERLRT